MSVFAKKHSTNRQWQSSAHVGDIPSRPLRTNFALTPQLSQDVVVCAGKRSHPGSSFTQEPKPKRPRKFYFLDLMHACQSGDVQYVKEAIESPALDVNRADNLGKTPLYIACKYEQVEIVKWLLQRDGIDVNRADKLGDTPLHVACGLSNIDIVKILLSTDKINVNAANSKGVTPLLESCKDDEDTVHIVSVLLKNVNININQTDNEACSPLWWACYKGNVNVVKMLLSRSEIDVNQAETTHGDTPLHIACLDDAFEIAKELVQNDAIHLNKKNKQSLLPLQIACKSNHANIAKILVYAGCEISSDVTNKPFVQHALQHREQYLCEYMEQKRLLLLMHNGIPGMVAGHINTWRSFVEFCVDRDNMLSQKEFEESQTSGVFFSGFLM